MSSVAIRRTDWRPAIRPLPAGAAVSAIGDVHGQDDLLGALLEALGEELSEAEERVVVLLGDLVDRGPGSIAALRRARAGLAGVKTVTLMGNHEDRMLRATLGGDPGEQALWLDFDGRYTLAEAGADPDDPEWPQVFRTAVGEDLLGWVAALPKSFRVGDLFFVHAGIDPKLPLDEQSDRTLIWTRRPFLDSCGPYPGNVAVVHGHTPQRSVDLGHPHRINLDTGAFRSGLLSGLVISSDRMRVVQAIR